MWGGGAEKCSQDSCDEGQAVVSGGVVTAGRGEEEGREGGRGRGREGGREEGRKGGRERGREGGREGGREERRK